jgi:RimJ/RimL family protein N-acetyltransferase
MFPRNVVCVALHLLNDHRVVDIRPIRSEDGTRLQTYHLGLSDESRYRRFLGVKPRLSDADARYLADVDGSNHFALVATCPATGHIVGVARFIRLGEQPDTAEFAVGVDDAFHRQGLAGELMTRLAAAARERGITHFRASMLADNRAIRKVMTRLAVGPVAVLQRGQVLELEIELAGHSQAAAA